MSELTRQNLLAEWAGKQSALGKHEAVNSHTIRRIVARLDELGLEEEASWARWMVWWAELDNQKADRFANELAAAHAEIERLQRGA